jgi:hypothetical protein
LAGKSPSQPSEGPDGAKAYQVRQLIAAIDKLEAPKALDEGDTKVGKRPEKGKVGKKGKGNG